MNSDNTGSRGGLSGLSRLALQKTRDAIQTSSFHSQPKVPIVRVCFGVRQSQSKHDGLPFTKICSSIIPTERRTKAANAQIDDLQHGIVRPADIRFTNTNPGWQRRTCKNSRAALTKALVAEIKSEASRNSTAFGVQSIDQSENPGSKVWAGTSTASAKDAEASCLCPDHGAEPGSQEPDHLNARRMIGNHGFMMVTRCSAPGKALTSLYAPQQGSENTRSYQGTQENLKSIGGYMRDVNTFVEAQFDRYLHQWPQGCGSSEGTMARPEVTAFTAGKYPCQTTVLAARCEDVQDSHDMMLSYNGKVLVPVVLSTAKSDGKSGEQSRMVW